MALPGSSSPVAIPSGQSPFVSAYQRLARVEQHECALPQAAGHPIGSSHEQDQWTPPEPTVQIYRYIWGNDTRILFSMVMHENYGDHLDELARYQRVSRGTERHRWIESPNVVFGQWDFRSLQSVGGFASWQDINGTRSTRPPLTHRIVYRYPLLRCTDAVTPSPSLPGC